MKISKFGFGSKILPDLQGNPDRVPFPHSDATLPGPGADRLAQQAAAVGRPTEHSSSILKFSAANRDAGVGFSIALQAV